MDRSRRPRPSSRRRWGPVAVLAVAILVASLLPVPSGYPGGASGPGADKVVHALAYAALGLALAVRAASGARGRARRAVGVFLAVVAYGAAIELLQAPIPWRRFGAGDLLANATGAGIGVVSPAVWTRVRRAAVREND